MADVQNVTGRIWTDSSKVCILESEGRHPTAGIGHQDDGEEASNVKILVRNVKQAVPLGGACKLMHVARE